MTQAISLEVTKTTEAGIQAMAVGLTETGTRQRSMALSK